MNNLKLLRINAGLTQAELGELCGIGQVSIARYESNGEALMKANFATIMKISSALKINAEDLIKSSIKKEVFAHTVKVGEHSWSETIYHTADRYAVCSNGEETTMSPSELRKWCKSHLSAEDIEKIKSFGDEQFVFDVV